MKSGPVGEGQANWQSHSSMLSGMVYPAHDLFPPSRRSSLLLSETRRLPPNGSFSFHAHLLRMSTRSLYNSINSWKKTNPDMNHEREIGSRSAPVQPWSRTAAPGQERRWATSPGFSSSTDVPKSNNKCGLFSGNINKYVSKTGSESPSSKDSRDAHLGWSAAPCFLPHCLIHRCVLGTGSQGLMQIGGAQWSVLEMGAIFWFSFFLHEARKCSQERNQTNEKASESQHVLLFSNFLYLSDWIPNRTLTEGQWPCPDPDNDIILIYRQEVVLRMSLGCTTSLIYWAIHCHSSTPLYLPVKHPILRYHKPQSQTIDYY